MRSPARSPKLPEEELKSEVQKDIDRLHKAKREKRTLLAQASYLGTLGLMLALPIIAGAYLGNWLDNRLKGYSQSWTITLIIIGVFVGAINVYLFIRENES
jgi:ATP synthase protein I